MATLEKIRSKSVLLFIVIFVALLAFILTDFFNSSRSLTNDTSVANVDGDKIEAAEFQNRQQRQNRGGSSSEENAFNNQQLLRQMIQERLLKEEYQALGLTVTDAELDNIINGSGSMFANRLVQQMTGGQFATTAQFYDFTQNPQKYTDQADPNETRQLWINFENQLVDQLLSTKFATMLRGTLVANKIDMAQIYNDANTAYNVTFAQKLYAGDPSIPVTDEELAKAWEENKFRFPLEEETRLIEYIRVPIQPSVEDIEAAEAIVKEVVAQLDTTPDLEALRGRKGFDQTRSKLTLAAIADANNRGAASTTELKAFIDSAKTGSAALISKAGNNYQIAKLFGRTQEVDSVRINFVLFAADDAAKADSIRAAVNAGTAATQLSKMDGVMLAMDSISTSLSNPAINLPGEIAQKVASDFQMFKSSFLNAETGKPFAADTTMASNGYEMLYTVTKRNAPESMVDIAFINYQLEPSKATINNLRQGLENFLSTNTDATKIAENAPASAYSVQYAEISASNPYVAMTRDQRGNPIFLPNSNEAAVWALENEKGAVSPIFGDERTGQYLVAALVDVYNDYTALTNPDVKTFITNKVRNAKEGDRLISGYTGKATTVEGFAQLMGTEPSTSPVNFAGGQRLYGPELTAMIANAPKGKVVGPVKGDNGVMVFQVNEVTAPVRPLDTKGEATLYNLQTSYPFTANGEIFYRLLLGDRKVENRINKIFKND